MSEAIVNARIIIFAGAGASAHLEYPSAAEFLQQLDAKVQEECDPPEKKVWRSAREYRDAESADTAAPNFEDMHDRLDAAIESEWLYKDPALPEGGGAYIPPPRKAAKRLREMMREEVIEVFGNRPPVCLGNRQTGWCWGELLKSVHPGEGHVVPLFTTNYDISFEYLSAELEDLHHIYVEDAFQRNIPGRSPWSRTKLSTWQPADRRYVWLFRLHGCVAWEKPLPDDTPPAPAYLYFDRRGQPASDVASWSRALVWPSKRKRPFEDPYWTEYRYFLRCLDNAKAIVFLGYGFGDDHIKAAVAEALKYNADLEVIAISDVAGEPEFRSRLSPIPSASVSFVEEQFTPEGIEELLGALRGFGGVQTRGGYIQHRTSRGGYTELPELPA